MPENQKLVIVSVGGEALESYIDSRIDFAVKNAISSLDTPIKDKKEWVTRKEAMAILGVSNPTIIEWGKNGIIPCHKISSRVRYKRSELEADQGE